MVYIGLVCALLIWTAKGPVPLAECRELHRAIVSKLLNNLFHISKNDFEISE